MKTPRTSVSPFEKSSWDIPIADAIELIPDTDIPLIRVNDIVFPSKSEYEQIARKTKFVADIDSYDIDIANKFIYNVYADLHFANKDYYDNYDFDKPSEIELHFIVDNLNFERNYIVSSDENDNTSFINRLKSFIYDEFHVTFSEYILNQII